MAIAAAGTNLETAFPSGLAIHKLAANTRRYASVKYHGVVPRALVLLP